MAIKSNDTLQILNLNLKTIEEKEKYLPLIISRMDESKRLLNKTLLVLGTLVVTFLLLAFSNLKNVDLFSFEKIDKQTIFYCLPSIFSVIYYYYILTWMHYIQQRKIYRHLTSQIFNLEVESYLNDHIQPFSFIEVLDKHHDTENKHAWGCLTTLILLPIYVVVFFSPVIFISLVFWSNEAELKLNGYQQMACYILPGVVGLLLILMFIKSFRLNVLGKE